MRNPSILLQVVCLLTGLSYGYAGQLNKTPDASKNKTILLSELFSDQGDGYSWEPETMRIHAEHSEHQLDAVVGNPFLNIDENVYRVDEPGINQDGVVVSQETFETIKEKMFAVHNAPASENYDTSYAGETDTVKNLPVTTPVRWKEKKAVKSAKKIRKTIIVIDPGHGGFDAGAIGVYGIVEKNVVLDIAKRLYRKLQKEPGVKVFITRDEDKYITLKSRTDFAKINNADVFISIHCNASGEKRIGHGFGIETYTYSEEASDAVAAAVADKENKFFEKEESKNLLTRIQLEMTTIGNIVESKRLAAQVHNELSTNLKFYDRGMKSGRFYVLKHVLAKNITPVLVELGFVDNRNDAKLLKSASYRDRIARTIANGITAYNKKFTEIYSTKRMKSYE